MYKIHFVNGQAPAINDTNLNAMQDNAEQAIADAVNDLNVKTKLSDFGTVLYNDTNGTGTNGTVTLSQSAVNFDCIEIYYYGSSLHSSTKIYQPNGKKACLMITAYYQQDSSNLYQYFDTKVMNISGTSMTVDKNLEMRFLNKTINNATQDNKIYIYRVVGYK